MAGGRHRGAIKVLAKMLPHETQEQPRHPMCEAVSPDEPYNEESRHLDPAVEQPADEQSLSVIETTLPGPGCKPTSPLSLLVL